jgi:D-arabinose 5-phosphate isomerase GutQ
MAHDHPIQNSEVYVLTAAPHTCLPASAPPSPPTPATPCDILSSPLDNFMSLTPPEIQVGSPPFKKRLSRAVHVLGTEATALSSLTMLYETDPVARDGFNRAVDAIKRFKCERGKLVICGVGKSGHIARKLVATMNSLKIHANYLHPTEALHGDLGNVGKYDTILLITFSGKTPELLQLLPHFDSSLPMIVMTSHTSPSTCEIVKRRPATILLPAPIHESETLSFGVSAPTTSTTMALALGDALAMVISEELHPSVAAVFAKNHPGGAIGAAFKAPQRLSDLAICLADMPDLNASSSTAAHVLMAAYQSESGWARSGKDIVLPPRRIKQLQLTNMGEPVQAIKGLMVPRTQWIAIPAETEVTKAIASIKALRSNHGIYNDDAILAVMDDDELVGVLEVGELLA